MGSTYSIDGVVPVVHPSAFVHPAAVLIGDVVVDERAYIGPMASLRGDFGRIHVGAGANVQDLCVLHCFPGRATELGEDAHIGHGAVLHGCTVGRQALVGISAVVMDGVVVGSGAFIGAASYVHAGTEVESGWLYAGSPARPVRELSEDELAWKARGTAIYQDLAVRCQKTLVAREPGTQPRSGPSPLPFGAELSQPLSEYRAMRSPAVREHP